jgi:peptidoglycan hydrolase-like protein with peptidoglycan-binding domain
LLITAALALTPALAFAEGDPSRHDAPTTTTTTTTSPSDSASGTRSSAASPEAPPSIDLNRQGVAPPSEPAIDPGQVQRVFGMDVALIDLQALNSDQIKQLQQRLSERGFYRGKVDGKMGPQTKNALSGLMAQQYALNQRLVSQGQITELFASSIGVDTAGRAPVSGIDIPEPPSTAGQPSPAPRGSEPVPNPAPRNEPSPRTNDAPVQPNQ